MRPKGHKQSPEHVAKRVESMRGKSRKPGAGRPANTPDVIWSKVDKRGPDECWPWAGYRNAEGYGRTWINDKGYYAHRVVFDLANPGLITLSAPRAVDEAGFILHSCDNPACCNPSHMRVGTHRDNMDDKVARGRSHRFRGAQGPQCKLTMEQAREARRLKAEGARTATLAAMFGISLPSMKTLIRGLSYQE